jgi:5'-nucleotidase
MIYKDSVKLKEKKIIWTKENVVLNTEPVLEAIIQTTSGKVLNLVNPCTDQICIEDIANGLAKECRFACQVNSFYSVAQHSVFVSHLLPKHLALTGLLHDATEGLGMRDLPTPLKKLPGFEAYRRMEACLEAAIASKWKLDWPWSLEVILADRQALLLEATHYKYPLLPVWKQYLEGIPRPSAETLDKTYLMREPWDWSEAYERFMARYEELNHV